MRGVTVVYSVFCYSLMISTHTPHARRDRKCKGGSKAIAISTHTPHARRDTQETKRIFLTLFQLTRLMRGVTQDSPLETVYLRISTHTPHARRDTATININNKG